jgi:hypothetical protein
MISLRITSADVVSVTGYSRHKLRSFLRGLPGYDDEGSERIAREYSVHDLIIIAICCSLEQQCGIRRSAIAELVPEIRAVLNGPRLVSSNASVSISLNPLRAEYHDAEARIVTGTVLPLRDIFEKINVHFGSALGNQDSQLLLDFGPQLIRGRKISSEASQTPPSATEIVQFLTRVNHG